MIEAQGGVCMLLTERLKKEMEKRPLGEFCPPYFKSIGYKASKSESPSGKRADAIESLFL